MPIVEHVDEQASRRCTADRHRVTGLHVLSARNIRKVRVRAVMSGRSTVSRWGRRLPFGFEEALSSSR